MIEVEASGLLTTVQDLGRPGYQRHGVTPGGAMDPLALRLANLLVGNDEGAPALELTLHGPTLSFSEDALVAVGGGDLRPAIDRVPLPAWRAVLVAKGATLTFGEAESGCRAYLALGGGIDVPEVMGSRSTYLRARLGGLEGRPLSVGDRLALRPTSPETARLHARLARRLGLSPFPFAVSARRLDDHAPSYARDPVVAALPGPEWSWFDEVDREAFFGSVFEVTSRSDRMGYRLAGPSLRSAAGQEMVSAAVLTGTVQVPPGGEAIVLMADRQTTGGYPRIAQVATHELPALAQAPPGARLTFEETTVEEAHLLLREQEERIRRARDGLADEPD